MLPIYQLALTRAARSRRGAIGIMVPRSFYSPPSKPARPAAAQAQSVPSAPTSVRISNRFRPGDWVCPRCEFINHSRRSQCLECDHRPDPQQREPALGDWICPHCQFYNFRKRLACKKCHELRPVDAS
ncbi:hypothetical protein BC940DRAFT_310521 [Gongronella butleri]|nr:hypothetical protein BC940DRAFT_310521 [Gongronella butleri]